MANFQYRKTYELNKNSTLFFCKDFEILWLQRRAFAVRPKRVKRTNGQVLTPDMEITVTTQQYTSDPFYNGEKEIQEQYMRMYQFDYKKSCCSKFDFEFKQLD